MRDLLQMGSLYVWVCMEDGDDDDFWPAALDINHLVGGSQSCEMLATICHNKRANQQKTTNHTMMTMMMIISLPSIFDNHSCH